MTTRMTIDLLAGRQASGKVLFEEVLVDPVSDEVFRVLATPSLVEGTAADDHIHVHDDGEFEVVQRGMNLAVHVYGAYCDIDEVLPVISRIGGSLDGRANGLTVFTIPVSVGFDCVERLFNRLAERHPEVIWFFGNVYDSSDEQRPLGWWEHN